MEDLPRIPPSDTKVIFIQIIISINIAITMKFTNGKLHHPQHNDDDDNPEDTPTGKSSVGILGVCHHHHNPHHHICGDNRLKKQSDYY